MGEKLVTKTNVIGESIKSASNLNKLIKKLNASSTIDGEVFESEFKFELKEKDGQLFLFDTKENYTFNHEEDLYYMYAEIADEFGAEMPKILDKVTPQIAEAVKADFGPNAYVEWEDAVVMIIVKGENESTIIADADKKIVEVFGGLSDEVLKTIYDSDDIYFTEAEDEDGKPFLILFSWADVQKLQKIINSEFEPKDESDSSVLDGLQNTNWGFVDEWSKCDECEKLIRTSPDSYSFIADYWCSEEHGLLCGDCVRDNYPLDYAQSLINNAEQANTILDEDDLEELGFTLIDKDFENGWYNRHDSPKEILATALDKHSEGAFLFSISGQGQFATQFELWGADIEEKDEEGSLEEGKDLKEEKELRLNAFSTFHYDGINSPDNEEKPYITEIIFKEGVTKIEGYAFANCTRLTSIIIPDSITEIRDWAFYGCTSLTSITIPDSVTEIEEGAFGYCTSLTNITIPDSVKEIGNRAFAHCTSLTNIIIPDSVTKIGDEAFYGCTSLTNIIIPNSVTEIGNWAFYNSPALTIYCEAESQPEGWDIYWNPNNRPVVWGYRRKELKEEKELIPASVRKIIDLINGASAKRDGYTLTPEKLIIGYKGSKYYTTLNITKEQHRKLIELGYGEESLKEENKLDETKLPYGLLSWKLGEVMMSMNDEEAYYGSWLYIWPDGETQEQCMEDFGTKEQYEDLRTAFNKYYKAYHKGGLYTDKQYIVDYAHQLDKELGLSPIENYGNIKKSVDTMNAEFQKNMKDDYVDDDSEIDADSIQVYEFPNEFENYLPELERLCKEHDVKFLGKGKNVIDDVKDPDADAFDLFVEGRYADLVALAEEFEYELHPYYLCSADTFAYEDILIDGSNSMKESTQKQIGNQRDTFRNKTKDRNPKDWTEEELIEDRELSARSMMISILVYSAETNWSDTQFDELFEREINNRYLEKYLKADNTHYNQPAISKERLKELWNDMVADFKHATVSDAGQDSEGVSYNSIKYVDESLKEAVEDKKGFTKEETTNFAKELVQIFFDDGGYYDIWAQGEEIQAQIYWGDWKHDHLYFKSRTQKFFNELGININIKTEVTEEDETDTYSALYTITKA